MIKLTNVHVDLQPIVRAFFPRKILGKIRGSVSLKMDVVGKGEFFAGKVLKNRFP
jgi:hypothetical protein